MNACKKFFVPVKTCNEKIFVILSAAKEEMSGVFEESINV